MSWSTVALLCLLPGSWLLASEGQKPSYPSFDYETARDHEIKPHRQTIPVDGIGQAWPGLHMLRLKLTVSPTGDVTHAEVIGGEVEDTRFWPQAEGEVYQWKFTPFKAGGKPVTTTVEERVELLPPERLPKRHVPPPSITKDSKVAITLAQWTPNCPLHTVTVSTDEIVFRGFGEVVAQGRHTDKIEKDAVIALAKRFAAADFYSMEDDYRSAANDLTSSLSITIDGRTKIVTDYEGQWAGMPAVIVDLEDEVDAVARTERWIKGGEGLVAALRTEKFNFASYDSQLIMETAAVYGQTATVRELLAAGVPIKPLPAPKIDNPYGGSFEEVQLLTAASMYPDTLQVFLDLGASKDDQREKDRALDGAARAGKLEAVRALIAYGANPNVDFKKMCNASVGVNVAAVDCEGLGSVLISAARSGNPELVKEILRYGPKLETREQNGKTALFVAGESTKSDEDGERVECVRTLAKAGASVDARDRLGNTLLHGGYLLDVDEELLRLGADVNARNHEGETPIFTNRNVRVIPLFLQHGADLTIRNNHGETVIEAQKRRGPDWDEALRKATAEVEHPQ